MKCILNKFPKHHIWKDSLKHFGDESQRTLFVTNIFLRERKHFFFKEIDVHWKR
jgi:hypothetical protein